MLKSLGRTKRLAFAAAAISTALLVSACSSGGGAGSTGGSGTYKIGVMLGLTGAYSAVAEPQKQALDLFQKNLDKAGGINGHPVEFVYVDSTSSESEAVNQLRKLATQDNVIGVVGPSSSGEGVALKPIAQSLKIPTIAIASGSAIVDPLSSYVYKEFPSAIDALNAQLAYLKSKGLKNVAMLSSNNAYGQEPANAIGGLVGNYGLNLVASETFAPDATDMTSQLTVVQRANPDALLVWAVNPANAIVAKNAGAIGFKPLIVAGSGAASAGYITLGGDATNGTVLVGSKILVDSEISADDPQATTIKQFAADWRAEYNTDPNQFAGGAWDAMLLMTTALEKGNIDPSNVTAARTALQQSLDTNIQKVPGTIAIYSFSPTLHGPEGIEGLAIIGVENGKFSLIAAKAGE